MSIAKAIILDEQRNDRLGFDEAILCAQKTTEQIAQIVQMSRLSGRRLFTKLDHQKFNDLPEEAKNQLHYQAESKTAVLGANLDLDKPVTIAIVSAGSSDAPIVAEAHATLNYYGEPSLVIGDVGVAGIWRLLEKIHVLESMSVIIAVAGMDAALPTVLGGLVPASIIGVPTSTGYGVAREGETALAAMLTSCAPGLTVVNIDNGYGAACAALRIINTSSKNRIEPSE